jgi:murein DD-endopeptidase MepM/ murein hydrolase activator NlpD
MLRYNRLSRSVLLCLSALLSGILFALSQPEAAYSRSDPRTSSPIIPQSASPASASPFESVPQDLLAFAPNRFLTLPFLIQPNMGVVQGWFYSWGGAHFGVDFIDGNIDNPDTWKTFDVVAGADGEACANCVDGPGNKVWIKHTIGNRVYYTYYGHLATIEPGILYAKRASMVTVTRGQKIGTAGNTGARYIHLHFGLYNASRVPVDPYDLYTDRSAYYPNLNYKSVGAHQLFIGDPPQDPSQLDADRSIDQHHPLRRSR